MTKKLKSICKVLKEMKLDVETRYVIAKNDFKDKKQGLAPAKLNSLEDYLGLKD